MKLNIDTLLEVIKQGGYFQVKQLTTIHQETLDEVFTRASNHAKGKVPSSDSEFVEAARSLIREML